MSEPLSRARMRELLGTRRIEHVVVLGANGTMGYGSGALFARSAARVTFLARTRDKAAEGLARAVKQVRSPAIADVVTLGSYDDDLERAVAEADLVFEAVAEDPAVKRPLFERIDAARRADAIVSTVTSGLSINQLAEGRSASFRRHFLGLHFFNPPNVIAGTELVPGRETDAGVTDFVEAYAALELGRVTVRTEDTPGFAGNRVGFKVLNQAAGLALEHGPMLIDRLIGPYTGRALAPLATIDLVGWDVHAAIVDNIFANTDDEAHAALALPAFMREFIGEGVLGRKSGGGFFKRDAEKRRLVLEPKTGDYALASEVTLPALPFIERVSERHRYGDYRGALAELARAEGEYARLARRVLAGYVSYALHRVGEVTRSLRELDLIMGFGFNWAPPGVLVDAFGAGVLADMMEASGVPVPAALERARRGDAPRFYDDRATGIGRFFVAA